MGRNAAPAKPRRIRAVEFAELPVRGKRLRRGDLVVKSHRLPHQQMPAGLFRRPKDVRRLAAGDRQRLFTEHMRAGAERRLGMRLVAAGRRADRHDIGGQFFQHLVNVIKHTGNRVLAGRRPRAAEVRVHDPDNLRPPLRLPGRDMRRVGNHAASDHGHSEFTVRHRYSLSGFEAVQLRIHDFVRFQNLIPRNQPLFVASLAPHDGDQVALDAVLDR